MSLLFERKLLAIFLYKWLLFYAMRCIVYLLSMLLLASFVSGATIYGTIYDLSLEKMENVIVEIDTEPRQQYISKNGTYAFSVSVGEYAIEAKHYAGDLLESSASERISVKGDGNFVLDLILFPAVDSELIGEVDDISFEDDYFTRDYSLIILVFVVIIVIFLILYFTKRKKPIIQEDSEAKGDYYDKVFSMIKENKRITQKDIRKQIPLSEAKISLIIAELEHKGLIEKIKKGRGNILILK